MIVGSLEIQLMANIARLTRDMGAARQVVTRATDGMERAANVAKSALAGIGVGIGLSQLVQMSDAYAKFTAQLRLASTSAREYAAAYDDVKRIAKDSQQGLGETGVLYARIANGTRELGTTQKQVAAITETVNMALKVSGATASESASAQLQLSQAFASGTLRGEEFNAVNEAAPRLMLALADGIGVPVGALKKMAENGLITSKIMADVLPKALEDLRREAKEVQTIAGAFTVLKNNVMEFVGVQANASGGVALLTGAIGLLAENLNVVVAAMTGFMAMKIVSYFFAGAAAIQAYIAKNAELAALVTAERASLIAMAQAQVASTTATVAATGATLAETEATLAGLVAQRATIIALRESAVAQLATARSNIASAQAAMAAAAAAGAQSFALRTLNLATMELSVAEQRRVAAMAEITALGIAQSRVSAQITAATAAQTIAANANTAATTAQAAAMAGAAGAAGRTAITASLATRALGFLGGPIGIITTLLGVGAAAWMLWGSKGSEAEKKVVDTLAEEIDDYLANLNKQIEKLKERNELAGKGMTSAAAPVTDHDKKREQIVKEIDRISKQTDLDVGTKTEMLRVWGGRLNSVTADMEKLTAEQQRNKDLAFATKYPDWLGKYGTDAQKIAYELEELRKEYGRVTPAMEAHIRAKYADKGAAAAIKQEATAYQNLMASIGEKIAANKLELSGYDKLSDAQKMAIKLNEAIASGKNKLTPKHIEEARAMIATVAAQDKLIEENKFYLEQADEKLKAAGEAIKAATSEAEKSEELARTFGLTKGAIEAMELARLEEKLAQADSTKGYTAEIAVLKQLIDAKKRSAVALGKVDELEAAKKAGEEWKKQTEKLEESLTDALMRGFESGKGFGRNLIDTLRNMFNTLVLRPIISAIVNPVAGAVSGALGMPGAASAAGGGGGAGSMLGTAASAAGSIFGAGGLAGSLAAGAGWVTGATTFGGAMGAAGSLMATGTLGGIASGIGMVAGALGPIGLALAAAVMIWKKLDTSGTSHTGGAARATSAGVSTIRAESIGFEHTKTTAEAEKFVAGLASGVVNILDSTALAFGKTAGYTAATAFADDTSKDGAWGALMIQKMGSTVLDWNSTRSSKWAPKEFGDGEAGQKQYLAALSTSVRTALDGIGLPAWAKKMLDGVGSGASIEDLAKVVDQINLTQRALASMKDQLPGFKGMTESAVSALMAASGGIEALAGNAGAYFDNFMTAGEKSAATVKQITEALTSVGVAAPTSREAFRALVEQQMKLGEAAAPTVAMLFKVAGAFAQVHPELEATANAARSAADILSERTDLQKQLDELTMSEIQLLNKQRTALDASNHGLFDQIQMAKSAKAAQDAAKTSLGDFISKMGSFATSAKSHRDSMMVGSLSTLTPEQQYAELRSQYASTKAAALGGDTTAQGKVFESLTAYLTASQKINGGDAQYAADFASGRRDAEMMSQWAAGQVDVAQASLNALNDQVSGIASLNQTMMQMAENIDNLPADLVATVAQAVLPVDYSRMGSSGNAELVAEIKSLKADLVTEIKGRRADAQRQAGDGIAGNAAVTMQAARVVADSVAESDTNARSRDYQVNLHAY